MRITVRREGGFAHLPGLAKPVAIDTASLTDDECQRLHALAAARGTAGHRARPRGRPVPDLQTHVVTVETGAGKMELDDDAFAEAGEAELLGRLKVLFKALLTNP